MDCIFKIFAKSPLLLACILLWCCKPVFAQTTMPTAGNTTSSANNTKDTSKTNTNKWKDEDPKVSYQKLNSARVYTIDTSLHTFERQPFQGTWGRNLGNLGSPINNLFFTPENRTGPSLGYHVYDAYRYNVDSLYFYSTSRPYSAFAYELGSKLEQTASIMHSQNVKPNWNITFGYRKINSPGFYQIQRNNHDNAFVSSDYKSLNKHYTLYAAVVYNKEQHDENGGVVDAEQLTDPAYADKRTVDVAYENSEYSATRSPVYNNLRDFTLLLQHSYTWGVTDTTYNADSTAYTYKLTPRFSITHKLELSSEKHTYNDLTPDSLRYITLFSHSFLNNGSGYYTQGQDSLYIQQNWFWIDNKVMLNGFVGKAGNQLEFSAGIGNRYDEFITQPVTKFVDTANVTTLNRDNIISNYVEGVIKKEALRPGEWGYGADAKFFLTGQYAGNLLLDAAIDKELKNGWGGFMAGFRQAVNSAPYSYTNYENIDTQIYYTFKPESVTTLYASLANPRLRLSAGVNNYVVANYIYTNENEVSAQYNIPFTVSQAWVRKVFKVGNFFLDKPIKGHTLMQTIARANRVYDDEKENGLIVDYGNVYKQLEKAYSVYGESDNKKDKGKGKEEEKPVELLIQLAEELNESIRAVKGYLKELGFDLGVLSNVDAKPMGKIANIRKAVDCVCLNETTRTTFEILARDVFRKYHALYPEDEAKPFIRKFNAIEAIYQQLNQQTKIADVTTIIMQLQQVVNESVVLDTDRVNEPEEVSIDLSDLDFDKLRAAFAKTERKNTALFNLQQAVEKKLEQMLRDNPLRLDFYDRYKKIIDEYNRGKDKSDTQRTFDNLADFIKDLSFEDARAMRENLDEETLAIYDLLKEGKTLSNKQIEKVKEVAATTLDKLKAEKLRVERWRESRQVTAQVKTLIYDQLQWLPEDVYTDREVSERSLNVYQHIYTNYPGINIGYRASA